MNELERFSEEHAAELTNAERARLGVMRFWLGLVFGLVGVFAFTCGVALLWGLSMWLLGPLIGYLSGVIWWAAVGFGLSHGTRRPRAAVYRYLAQRAERRLAERRRLAGAGGHTTSVGVGTRD